MMGRGAVEGEGGGSLAWNLALRDTVILDGNR